MREDTGVHRLLTSLVAPHPIGWISTVDADGGANLAPYSYFNLVHTNPGVVMFAAEDVDHGVKDTPSNAIETGEFVVNLVTESVAERMEQIDWVALPTKANSNPRAFRKRRRP